MKPRLPAEAFSYYVGLGPDRSYEAVAKEFGVSKRTVVRRAVKDDWKTRIQGIESEARERVDKKAVETIEQMADRHMKILRVIQSKALQALQQMEIASAMDAVRSLDLAVKAERIVRGEPGDRTALSFEEIAQKQNERWRVRESGPELTNGNGGV